MKESIPESTYSLVMPSWPLQNVAAVNPFWNLRGRSFYEVLSESSPVLHASLFMPLAYYLDQFASGNISDASVRSVLTEKQEDWPETPVNVDDLVQLSRGAEAAIRKYATLAEHLQANQYWHRCVVDDFGKFAAAYLDQKQALAPFPWKEQGFWKGWLAAQKYDRSMRRYGAPGFSRSVAELQDMEPSHAIDYCLKKMGILDNGKALYLQRLMASVLGWATAFRYEKWQSDLGYPNTVTPLVEVLSVRLAYDYGLFQFAASSDFAPALPFWQTVYNEFSGFDRASGFHLHYIWQSAMERSFQKRIVTRLQSESTTQLPKYQMAFCIDVRSEVIRRKLEEDIPEMATIGFAGFFGLPFSYRQSAESSASNRLPVLLSPAFEVREQKPRRRWPGGRMIHRGMVLSYFRNLRKGSLSSFLFVELFGLISVESLIRNTFLALVRKLRRKKTPSRFDDSRTVPDINGMYNAEKEALSLTDKLEFVRGALRHTGLRNEMANYVIFSGHGADTVNNAFASALDCGACGGHAGDINVRLLCRLLNDPEIRNALQQEGQEIPGSTVFVPAIHETVSDEIHFLDEDLIPAHHRKELQALKVRIRKSSLRARQERSAAVSAVLDPHFHRRSRNWSETRPEWGLTGNACFIVAPRYRTRGANLGGRSFLHEYDWKSDDEFKTLELIMTAPMVVTNWINMQYYASAVAPEVYGGGSKVLQNLVNEMGVQEGNGGNLRVGLPLQSVHDGEKIVHEPLRLTVFIEAPQEAIEGIVRKHEAVQSLLDNEWILLAQVSGEGNVQRRLRGGRYVSLH